MLDPMQLQEHVIVPVLEEMDVMSVNACELLLYTAYQESHLTYLKQLGGGPALGLWQMEPVTHEDIWINFLNQNRSELANLVMSVSGLVGWPQPTTLMWNLRYACAMARVHYLRVPEALPEAGDVQGMGEYWKQHYNTEAGKGSVEDFVRNAKVLREAM